jgi:hypothetical protein
MNREAVMTFFTEDTRGSGPALTDEMVQKAEAKLGFRLPASYIALLRERNGGVPNRRCFCTGVATSWAADHVEISSIIGLGFEDGVDGELGSAYMVQEWGYPDIGLVICETPSGGHDTVMLDYRACGRNGEPQVVYIDGDRSILPLAPDFGSFIRGLTACSALRAT